MLEVSVTTLKSKLDAGDDFILLDVREPFEVEIASVPGALCIPMNHVPQRVQELDPDAEILVMCRSGKRSADITGGGLGSGCTSGHGVCGMSRLSQRSLVATATFLATGFATVAAMNALGIAVLP